jgi:glycosyltransferase involved in cell wall biosynthesis
VIYNGLNIQDVERKMQTKLPKEDETELQVPTILFLGRLHKLKRIDLIIEALSIIRQRVPGTKLVIAGPDNGELKNLQKQTRELNLEDQVFFLGPVYGRQKWLLYKSADVLAYPSSHEVFGLVPFEALLCGTPVIVTEGTGMGGIIAEIDAGITVPQDDPRAIAEACLWVLNHPIETQQAVSRGLVFINQNLRWESIVQEYEYIYQKKEKK